MSSPSKFAKANAAGGVLAWMILLFLTTSDAYETQLIHSVALFGILVIVPLGLSLVATDAHSLLYKSVVALQPFAALCLPVFTLTAW